MNQKKIAVLGGGNGAHALAFDLITAGHEVRMFFRSRRKKIFDTGCFRARGILNGTVSPALVTDDLALAVRDADCVFLVVPAYAHDNYAEMLKGLLHKDQLLFVFPGAFASLQFRKAWGDEDCPVIIESNNLPYGARMPDEDTVEVYNRNPLSIGIMPACRSGEILQTAREITGPVELATLLPDILACGLSLVNPATHPGPCLINASNIERPNVDFYLYEHGFSPSAAKLMRETDRERVALAAALGYDIDPVPEAFDVPKGYTWEQLYKAIHGNITHTVIAGPNDLQNRYLTEDTPYGLVPWTAIARMHDIRMPAAEAMITLYGIIHEKDWFTEGLSAAKMGLDHFSADELKSYLYSGKRTAGIGKGESYVQI